jgi:hypothetical protein
VLAGLGWLLVALAAGGAGIVSAPGPAGAALVLFG